MASHATPSTAGLFSDLLKGLPDDTTRASFTSIQSLRKRAADQLRALQKDQTRNQFLVFVDVPYDEFLKIEKASTTNTYIRWIYEKITQLLIIKVMASPEHESAIESFKLPLYLQIANMGLDTELDLLGTTSIHYGSFSKRADACLGLVGSDPIHLTTILEVGLSESSPKLTLDAQGWLLSNGSTVQIAITIEISRSRPEIVVRCWEHAPCLHDHKTPRKPSQSAVCRQEVSITYTNNATVVTGPITLSFQKVVGRPINPSHPQETDFAISANDLTKMAEKVWKRQKFIP
jgi:hypothetical protein